MTKNNNKDPREKISAKFNAINCKIVSKIGFPSKFRVNENETEKTVLVIRDYNLAEMYAKTCKVIYITDRKEFAQKFANNVIDASIFGTGDIALYVPKEDIWSNVYAWWPKNEKGELMKFDVCIGNPPYKSGLHLKILEQTVKHADNVVFIHPAAWLQFPTRKRPKYLNGRIKDFTMIDRNVANATFGIDGGDLVITEVCKENGGSFSGTPVMDPSYPCFKFNSRFV